MGIEALLERLECGSGTYGTSGKANDVPNKSLPVLNSTPGTSGTLQNDLEANKIKPGAEKNCSHAEKLVELDLLIDFVAANNDFTEKEIMEAKKTGRNNLENALVSYRELAKTIRQEKAITMLEKNPNVPRTIYIDTGSDPQNVILTIAIRSLTTCEMIIDKAKYDPWRLITMMDSTGAPH